MQRRRAYEAAVQFAAPLLITMLGGHGDDVRRGGLHAYWVTQKATCWPPARDLMPAKQTIINGALLQSQGYNGNALHVTCSTEGCAGTSRASGATARPPQNRLRPR